MRTLLLFILAAICASATVGKVDTEHFVVYFDKDASQTARMAAKAAEEARDRTYNVLGIRAKKRIAIRIQSAAEDFSKKQPGERVPGWAVGTAYASRNAIFIMQPHGVKLQYNDIREVVTHEYIHVAVGNYLEEVDVPRWLDEGLADFVGGERSWTAPVTLGTASITGRLIPLAALKNYWPQSAEKAKLAYAQASDFAAFIEREYGPGAIKRLLKLAHSTGDLDAAFRSVTGKGVYELEKEWIEKVARYYKWIPLLSGGLTLWAGASVLVVLGFIRKKRVKKLKYQLWELEERMGGFYAKDDDSDDEDDYFTDDEPPPPGDATHH